MAERKVQVRLSAQVQEYISGMEKAAQATRETGGEAEKLAQRRQAFQTLGTAAVAVGGAITAIGVAAMKTGIEYNTLQQSSRAALTTILGSAEAANAQMDKLDDFARNSPFAKQVFIEAQQQMLAFGIEAERVVPYLESIQDAVAASGGSNQDIAELAEIFGKISSSSKITAIDLQQFGRRGINAAELIGNAMGKTGAEIREEITAGTLDADLALEALAAGMSTRFEGAAANVKETFDGAMDRVKAAWRDLAAELASPLVDPEGGGALVDILNWAADAMRRFQELPEPIKATALAIGGVTGATLLASGTIALAIPKIADYRKALIDLDIAGGRLDKTLRFVGKAAGFAAAIGVVIALSKDAEAEVTGLSNALERGANSAEVMGEAIKAQESKAGAFAWATKDLALGVDEVSEALDYAAKKSDQGIFRIDPANKRTLDEYIDTLGVLGDELAQVGATDLPKMQAGLKSISDEYQLTERQQWAFIESSPDLKRVLEESAEGFDLTTDKADLLKIAFGDVKSSSKDAADGANEQEQALESLRAEAEETERKVADLADEIRNFGAAELDTREANRKFEASLDDLAASLEDNGDSLDINTEKGRSNESAIDDVARATLDAAAATYEQTGSLEKASKVIANGREQLIKMLTPLLGSRDAAEEYADKLGLIPENIDTDVALHGTESAEEELARLTRDRMIRIGTWLDSSGNERIDNWAFQNASGGMYSYADGGMQSYANGGMPTGIYTGGVPLYKFAEPETGWEAFISGKPDQRDRNRQIWVETGERLGMDMGVQNVTVYVQNPFTGKYLLEQVNGVANQAIDAYTEQAAQAARKAGR